MRFFSSFLCHKVNLLWMYEHGLLSKYNFRKMEKMKIVCFTCNFLYQCKQKVGIYWNLPGEFNMFDDTPIFASIFDMKFKGNLILEKFFKILNFKRYCNEIGSFSDVLWTFQVDFVWLLGSPKGFAKKENHKTR